MNDDMKNARSFIEPLFEYLKENDGWKESDPQEYKEPPILCLSKAFSGKIWTLRLMPWGKGNPYLLLFKGKGSSGYKLELRLDFSSEDGLITWNPAGQKRSNPENRKIDFPTFKNATPEDVFKQMTTLFNQRIEIEGKETMQKSEQNNSENNYEALKKQLKKQLEASHQIILTGAPGTGKTFAAKEIAAALTGEAAERIGEDNCRIGFVQFHPSMDYTDFVEGLRPVKGIDQIGFERQDGIFKAFCKKALENRLSAQKTLEQQTNERNTKQLLNDFLNDAIENDLTFTLKRGNSFTIKEWSENSIVTDIPQNSKVSSLSISYRDILTLLKEDIPLQKVDDIRKHFNRINNSQADSYIFVLCKEIHKKSEKNKNQESGPAQKEEEKKFVFIIDEINRGDIAKIFGELFYAIDPSYRGIKGKITTQYQNLVENEDLYADGFYVPENVYIIGTMNDIDRGVESMDFAIRRRFTWIEVAPKDTQNMLDSLDENIADKAKKKMNALNDVITDKIGSAYQIGTAYFMKLKHDELNGDFDDLWKYHLEPLLREYLRGESADEIKKKISDMKTAYDNPPKDEKSEITEGNASDGTDINA